MKIIIWIITYDFEPIIYSLKVILLIDIILESKIYIKIQKFKKITFY